MYEAADTRSARQPKQMILRRALQGRDDQHSWQEVRPGRVLQDCLVWRGRNQSKGIMLWARGGRHGEFIHEQVKYFHDGWTLQPSYGAEGKAAKFCTSHAEAGMVRTSGNVCGSAGCTTSDLPPMVWPAPKGRSFAAGTQRAAW